MGRWLRGAVHSFASIEVKMCTRLTGCHLTECAHSAACRLLSIPPLQFLVALQAALTVVGNCTCWWAAYRIYQWAEQEGGTA